MITVQIATLPEREDRLKRAVDSLINQVDTIFVALNGHKEVPGFLLGNPKIEYKLMDNSLGDGAKFYNSYLLDGYILTCDDDLAYAPGYASYMVDGLNRHGGIVTILGKQYADRPIESFRRGYTKVFSCLNAVSVDSEVDIAGTGVMAYHTNTIKIIPEDFPRKNMADIWVAKLAKENGVRITSLAHPKGYVIYNMYEWRIWKDDYDDKYETDIVNSFLK